MSHPAAGVFLLLCALLTALPDAHAQHLAASSVPSLPPTTAEAVFYTRPLVRARLRLPQSLHNFAITHITPTADDAARFEVQVRFKAKTPFGSVTGHSARFMMKRGSRPGVWIVTAD